MERVTIFHIVDGAKDMYIIDANHALASFPDEWSKTPYLTKEEQKAMKAQKEQEEADAYAREQALKGGTDTGGKSDKDSKAS